MVWMKTAGGILKQDGKIAIAEACCCEGTPCCDCDWVREYADRHLESGGDEPSRILATFSGAASGTTILTPQSSPLGFCWEFFSDDFNEILTDCGLWVLQPQMNFRCHQEDTSIEQMEIDVTTDEFCLLDPVNGEFVEGSCGPPFYLKKKFTTLTGTDPPGCTCPEGSEVFVVLESIDPWP